MSIHVHVCVCVRCVTVVCGVPICNIYARMWRDTRTDVLRVLREATGVVSATGTVAASSSNAPPHFAASGLVFAAQQNEVRRARALLDAGKCACGL